MTDSKPKEANKKAAMGWLIGALVTCMLISLFPTQFSKQSVSRPLRAHATVIDIKNFEGSVGLYKVATYEINGQTEHRTQVFRLVDWPILTVGSEVEIAYNPNPQNTDAALIVPGTSPYDTPVSILVRGLMFTVSLIALFYILWEYGQGKRKRGMTV